MDSCVFCKILNKELPCYKIYEDDVVLAFLDIAGKDYGHTLVIPKAHCKNCLDCDDNLLKEVIVRVKKIAKHFVEDCDFKGAVILNANNKEADQTVFHLHFHIVPKGDKFNMPANAPFEEQQKRLKL